MLGDLERSLLAGKTFVFIPNKSGNYDRHPIATEAWNRGELPRFAFFQKDDRNQLGWLAFDGDEPGAQDLIWRALSVRENAAYVGDLIEFKARKGDALVTALYEEGGVEGPVGSDVTEQILVGDQVDSRNRRFRISISRHLSFLPRLFRKEKGPSICTRTGP